MALPLVLFAAIEGLLRLVRPDEARPLFVPAPMPSGVTGAYLVANPRVGRRYFRAERSPPAPQAEPFAATKPTRAFRVFVLGESTTAGFPYPRNGTFSRLLRDALRDVLPQDSVEVVNLGIAATNSYTLLDLASDVAAQRPDAVLIYAGHNEYYGALGVGSAQGGAGGVPSLVRASLALGRLRTVTVLRDAITAVGHTLGGDSPAGDSAGSFMEVLARDRRIDLDGTAYRRGVRQFEANLRRVARAFTDVGIPVLVGSLASNLRDQPPFASPINDAPGGAAAVFSAATDALAHGDTARARALFTRARDLDVVRFRAPTAFDTVIRRVAQQSGITYVPVREAFESASVGGIPGSELFLEHVHPNRRGYALIARTFFEALREARFLGHQAQLDRLRAWDEYLVDATLTPFDDRVAHHTVMTLRSRWPFVTPTRQTDYRANYRPSGGADSLALLVSRGGIAWHSAKLEVADEYQRRGVVDSAIAEYRGLERDMPFAELPFRLEARALLTAKRRTEAQAKLERALQLEPTSAGALALGTLAVQENDLGRGISFLEQATALDPTNRPALYQLSLAYGLARDIEHARATALRLFRMDPRYPGLRGWMETIGMGS